MSPLKIFVVVRMDAEYPSYIDDISGVFASEASAKEMAQTLNQEYQSERFQVHDHDLVGVETLTGECLNTALGGEHGPARPRIIRGYCYACAAGQKLAEAAPDGDDTEGGTP